MPRISVVTLAIILLFALESCSNPKPQQFASSGVVSGQQDEEGHIWFEFDRADQRFVIDFSLDADAVFSVLKDSSQTGRSVTVHYDARSGRFDGHAGKPIYVARSLSY